MGKDLTSPKMNELEKLPKEEKLFIDEIKKGILPRHIAIIMDGNGRWAKAKGLPRTEGHKEGIKAVMSTVEGCIKTGVKCLSLFAFSTENINRPKEEVSTLFELFVNKAYEKIRELQENNVKVTFAGNYLALDKKVVETINFLEEQTRNNTQLHVRICLNYSGTYDIINAIKSILLSIKEDIKNNPSSSLSIIDKWLTTFNEKLFEKFLSTRDLPPIDIFIRTGGEIRISNFYLYQISYTELFFLPILWPDFRKEHLYDVIIQFQKRERRFGLVT